MIAPDDLLRNARNDPAVFHKIKAYFYKYPNSTAKECCRVLELDYLKYGGRARKIKHDIGRWKRSIVTVTDEQGRPLNPLASVHGLELRFRDSVPASFIVLLEEKARQGRIGGEWYRSPNRNRQLEYFDERVSVRVYPKSGTCRILPRRSMTFEDVRVLVEDAFAKAIPTKALLSEPFRRMRDGLQVISRHRTFPVGPITPFKVNFYKPSLGLDILADGSHPEHLEVRETWPTWIPHLFELQRKNSMAVSEFAAQIESHLNVMRGIALAANRLNETIRRFQQLVGGKELDMSPPP